MLSRLALRDASVMAVIQSLVEYSKTFDYCHGLPFQTACVAPIARSLVSFCIFQGASKSGYRGYVLATKLMRHFLEGVRLVENLKSETASEDYSGTRYALGAIIVDNVVLQSAYERDFQLCTWTAAARTQSQRQKATIRGRDFSSNAASLLQELRTVHSTACQKHLLSLKSLALAETPQK